MEQFCKQYTNNNELHTLSKYAQTSMRSRNGKKNKCQQNISLLRELSFPCEQFSTEIDMCKNKRTIDIKMGFSVGTFVAQFLWCNLVNCMNAQQTRRWINRLCRAPPSVARWLQMLWTMTRRPQHVRSISRQSRGGRWIWVKPRTSAVSVSPMTITDAMVS